MSSLELFHPAVRSWFEKIFQAPTEVQNQAWPSIHGHQHTLLAAPTGSGKTLAAFLAAINELVEEAQQNILTPQTKILYISPLKALSNDVHKNLEEPLRGIRKELFEQGFRDAEIVSWVRTGDTPSAERTAMAKNPPHILVTTPESLYLLLTSVSGRKMLRTVRTVIIDEIHAVLGSKRGSHLSLSLERLQALVAYPLVRIGLSATQKPMDEVARFLLGDNGHETCNIIDIGHLRRLDLGLEVPKSPLEAVMSKEVWAEIYERLAELIREHKTTLIFVNTRRLAERVAGQLSEIFNDREITSHHGSLSKERRLKAEQRLKNGELRALVATASLELGIDIGSVDLVCQLSSPRTIAAFLQRAGRANHSVGGLPKARIFPLSRDELVECAAILESIKKGELDQQIIPQAPLDVLAQQIAAAVAAEEWGEDELFNTLCKAYPYRDLKRSTFDEVVTMLSEGFITKRGRRGTLLHRDAVNKKLRARKGTRLTTLTNGGAIPETADYQVVVEPSGLAVGTVNEDFAVESLAGDIFQLGNTSWKILRVEPGKVRVEDAHGQPPSVPFWLGEAPGRSDELSAAIDRLRTNPDRIAMKESGVPDDAINQILDYLNASRLALGTMPSQNTLVLERFFDESGGMQLVLHSPFGSRVNRAWGLALRKRFCKTFNFELQAAATEDAIVISLGPMHSFPLEDVFRFLNSKTVTEVLTQALLDAPMFEIRWRWNANRFLAVPRYSGGKKVPPPIQRMQAADLLALTFPDQAACQENIVGKRQIPDHPLVNETIHDCLHEAMDINKLISILQRIENNEIITLGKDVTEPSPLAQEILTARPYAFLDDAPLEERRTQAVYSRRWLDPKTASDLGTLDSAAIDKVRAEAWPEATNADELHDALLWMGCMMPQEAQPYQSYFDTLLQEGRATIANTELRSYWVATERVPQAMAAFPGASVNPPVTVPSQFSDQTWTRETAVRELVRGRLEISGPITTSRLAEILQQPTDEIELALAMLEKEGSILRGRFETLSNVRGASTAADTQWCERRLLSRIHRYTLNRLRAEIEPVSTSHFMRFLFDWQHVSQNSRMEGAKALSLILAQLEGYSAPAAAWETEILATRFKHYDPAWMDALSVSGKYLWCRTSLKATTTGSSPMRSTPIIFSQRKHLIFWQQPMKTELALSADAHKTCATLKSEGPLFFDELAETTGLLPTQLELALSELVAKGQVRSDSFAGLRKMLKKKNKSHTRIAKNFDGAGRWVLVPPVATELAHEHLEQVARILLLRYGVVFRKLIEPEDLPPWRELVFAFRRMEARGEIRGGRFVAGFSGEQYAMPEAIGLLREIRRAPLTGEEISVSAADPLNLVGVITPGEKIPGHTKNRVLFRDGIPIAAFAGEEVKYLADIPQDKHWHTQSILIRTPAAMHGRGFRVKQKEMSGFPKS